MSVSHIRELAQRILENTAEIDSVLQHETLSSPSFGINFDQEILEKSDISQARQAVLEATDELHALMLGPVGQLTSHSHEIHLTLQALYRFNLASFVPLPDSASTNVPTITFSEIGQRTGLPELSVKRILKHAMTYRIFCEPTKGTVAHTAASKALVTNEGVREWVGLVGEEMWGAAARTVDAVSKWPSSSKPNHSGFNLAHATLVPVFDFLASHPPRQARYSNAMSWFSSMPALSPHHIISGFPWSSLPPQSTVVDVGGGHGDISVAIASAFPTLNLVVQDRAEVVAQGCASLPEELRGRVDWMAHDLFAPQPVKGAAVYLLRWILHDWSDAYAIKILRMLVPALKTGSRLCIGEMILPESGSISLFAERKLRSMDLAMLGFHNAKERDVEEWEDLLRRADERFSLVKARRPEGSMLACIEVGWKTP